MQRRGTPDVTFPLVYPLSDSDDMTHGALHLVSSAGSSLENVSLIQRLWFLRFTFGEASLNMRIHNKNMPFHSNGENGECETVAV
jgi:hypothetical protein